MGDRSHVFISYARQDDSPFVERLRNDLINRGVSVWWEKAAMEAAVSLSCRSKAATRTRIPSKHRRRVGTTSLSTPSRPTFVLYLTDAPCTSIGQSEASPPLEGLQLEWSRFPLRPRRSSSASSAFPL